MTFSVLLPGPADTWAAGDALGRLAPPGSVVTLQGPLGAGKTAFAQGVARGLDVPGWCYVTSPTYALHNRYEGRLALHHFDLYRLAGPADLEDLGLEDALYGADLCVLEWPDRFFADLPPDRLQVRFGETADGGRILDFESCGPRSAELAAELRRALQGFLRA